MKKLSILLVMVLGFSFVSCSKDDNNSSQTTSGDIIRKWEYSKQGAILSNGQEVLVDYTGNSEGCSKDFITLSANLVYTDNYFTPSDVPGGSCYTGSDSATYVKTGNSLIITYGTGTNTYTETFTILTLSNTELKVKELGGAADGAITLFKKA